jgi:hypothetical protein
LEYAREIFYSPQKILSNGLLHISIENDLTPILKAFVVGSQIPNLTLGPSLVIKHAFQV